MSNIFDALNSSKSTVVNRDQDLPNSFQQLKMPESDNCWKERYYPKFAEYKIEPFLDYLLSLHDSGEGKTYGVIPVSDTPNISQIVLETTMHISANCEGKTLLTDLSNSGEMRKQLEETQSFDRQISPNQSPSVQPILHGLFDFLSFPTETLQSNRNNNFKRGDLFRLSRAYQFSLFMFPTVANFNTDCVRLVRQLDHTILISPENTEIDLDKTGKFVKKLGVNLKGVYLFE